MKKDPSTVQALVDKYGSQYKGGNQHDAQEFLLWLLDKVTSGLLLISCYSPLL